jgi:transposase
MAYRKGMSREQMMLLPRAVEDYVSEENPVRVIDAFIEGVDLAKLGMVIAEEDERGAPAYDPRAMLKLYVYGYLNRIRSSRELAKAVRRNLEVIWLMQQLSPEYWAISDFRRQNRHAFKALFREFNLICGKLKLFGAELVAIDGCFFKGVNAPRNNFTQNKLKKLLAEIDEKTEDYLKSLEAADLAVEKQGLEPAKDRSANLREKITKLKAERERCAELLREVEQSPTGQVSLTDPDTRSLKKTGERVVGYNTQIAVDAKHHLIVAEEVTQEPSDWKLLEPMATAAKDALGVEQLKAVADAGYYSHEQMRKCAAQGIEATAPNRQQTAGAGLYPLEAFRHDVEKDCFVCPQGRELRRHQDWVEPGKNYHIYYDKAACADCPVRAHCTRGKYRKLAVPADREFLDAVQQRWRENPELRKQRSQLVEHPFGTMKFWWGYRSFLCRGIEMVRAEFSLSSLAYNLRRVLNLFQVRPLIEALQA